MQTGLLADRLWPVTAGNGLVRGLGLAIIGAAAVALAAQVSVPMIPVSMTLQTLAVLLVGAAYGARLGTATLALYALEGALGLPVFANFQGGYQVIAGPTGGYIFGFILAAGLVGYLAERGWAANPVRLMAASLAGAAILYVPGLLWLVQFTGVEKVLALGLYPFLLGDAIKAVLAALALPGARALIGERP
jgi:biotin transport system substrate-specific component